MKTWFITGASGGLATSVIKQLLQNGDQVAATTRKLGSFAELKEQYHDQLWETTMNLADSTDVNRVVEEAFDHFGTVDVLLNNAAYGLYGAVEEFTDQQIQNVFQINVFGSLYTARAFLPHFRQQGHGQIIQISSMAGQYSTPAMGLYSASKWAVEASFEALAKEVAEFNVQTTIVEPGGIRTNFAGGHGVFSEPMDVYKDTDAGKITALISGRVPAPAGMGNSILGDPDKMAQQIIERAEHGQGPLRLALGSDSYNKMHEGLENRLVALEDQKESAGVTDYK